MASSSLLTSMLGGWLAANASHVKQRRTRHPRTASVHYDEPPTEDTAAQHATSCSTTACLSLWQRLWSPATVVTMEDKYAVCSCVAEFWCSVTSIVFASPCLMYLILPAHSISWQMHVCCAFSMASAIVSTVYHWTLYKIFSSLDAAVACATMHTFMLLVLGQMWPDCLWLSHPWLWTASILAVLTYILHRWEHTARPAVQLMGLIVALHCWGLMHHGYWEAMLTGLVGIMCFLVDRRKMLPVHSIWHIGGGLSLGITAWSVVARQLAIQ